MRATLLLLLLVRLYSLSSCQDVRDSMKQLTSLLNKANIITAPFPSNSTTLNIGLSFDPATILEVDSARQILTFTGTFVFRWNDPKLVWNPTDYNGFTRVAADTSRIWTPKAFIINGIENIRLEEVMASVVITRAGIVNAVTFAKYAITCSIDVFAFPFDTQDCEILITSPDPNVRFHPDSVKYGFNGVLSGNSEWEIVNISSTTTNGANIGIYALTLSLKRRSSFYVTSIIFPMALTSVMNAFVFLLPVESGEKMSFLVSIFVSHAVFLGFVNDIMPRTSETPPKLTIYLICILCQSFAAILITAISLLFHHGRENQVVDISNSHTSNNKGTQGRSGKKRLGAITLPDLLCFLVFLAIALINTVFLVI